MDIRQGEKVEGEIDTLIVRRDSERRRTEGERAREMLWKASVARYRTERQEEMRLAWIDHHARLQRLHQDLANEHADALERLQNGHEGRNGHHGE